MARKRRTAEEAREEILAVSTRQLRDHGVAGLRLDEIAAEIGVSRQAILHHFGSREGLVREVVRVAWTGMFGDLLRLTEHPEALTVDTIIEQVDDVTRKKGNARLGAWLLLSGEGLPADVFEGALANLPTAMAGEGAEGEVDDLRYAFLLIGSALFGDAVFGARLRQALRMPDGEEERGAFHRWLAARLLAPRAER